MPKLTGYPWEEGREYFKEQTNKGHRRCQAYAKNKKRKMIKEFGEDNITPEMAGECQCGWKAQDWTSVCWQHGAGKKEETRGGRPPKADSYWEVLNDDALRELYERQMTDAELIALRKELAVIGTIAVKSLEEWAANPPDIKKLGGAVDQLGEALEEGSLDNARSCYENLNQIITGQKSQWAATNNILEVIEAKRRTAKTEMQRLDMLQTHLDSQRAIAMVMRLSDIVVEILDRYDVPNTARQELYMEVQRMLQTKRETPLMEGEPLPKLHLPDINEI